VTFWRRCRPPHAPVDLRGLHAVTLQLKFRAKQFQTLTTNPEKDTLMSTPTPNPSQADIDADVAALNAVFTTLGTVFTDLAAQLAALPASVDTSALDALVATGQASLAAGQALDTINPPAPPAP
jgi:hypothetical protein